MLRKILITMTFFVFCLALPGQAANLQPPQLDSDFAILIDGYTGKVFYEKNADSRAYPASTTKILTLITALENNNRQEIVTVSAKAAAMEGSSAYLRANEQYSFSDILYGMMLPSGNDAAVALAEHIAGSTEKFALLMNATAKMLGAKDSNFVNPSGLPDNNHYTTARDMAKIARYAMQNQAFREVVATPQIEWPRKNGLQPAVLKNTNMFMTSYFGANGIKTGYTRAAQRCLVASAQRNGVELIAVLFHSQPYCWNDAAKIMNYGFDLITPRPLYQKGEAVKILPVYNGESEAILTVQEDIVLPLADDFDKYKIELTTTKRLFAPVNVHQEAGLIRIFYDGQEIKKIKLVVKEPVAEKQASSLASGF